MTVAGVIGAVYALVAVIALAVARARRATLGALGGLGAYSLMGLLWPFFLPTLNAASTHRGPYSARLDALHRALEDALSDPASAALLPRPQGELRAALERLDEASRRLAELDHAIARALPSARSRLETLRDRADCALAERAALLEEVAAQLTVLRFADLSAEDAGAREREEVRALLAQLDALAAG